jgi:hypothetical protein
LILALVLAVLYFMLIELLMIDATRELGEARRFRSRIVALTLAENGAELAARNLAVPGPARDVRAEDEQGTIEGRIRKKADGTFEIIGTGQSKGLESTHARVLIEGRIERRSGEPKVVIEYTRHTQ